MLVHWATGGGGSGGGAAAEEAASAPLELDVHSFTTDAAPVAESYQHMDELVKQLQQGMAAVLARPDATAAAAASGRAVAEQRGGSEVGTSGRRRGSQLGEEEPPGHPLQEGPPRQGGGSGMGYESPRWPGSGIGVGGNDLVPPGLHPPGISPIPGRPLGGLGGGAPGLGGGGMHVGPHHPMFGPGRLGGTMGGGPGGIPPDDLPPGARWDPIAPPGLPGFRPGDFRPEREGHGRPRPPMHPDVMQPGAGGGGDDFDSMFG